jgi:nitroimidazol reductase NimA-like FMN-containing flavoprotein (pyridoxamine 5'-phosphate oxidase superfamily)
VPQEQKFGAIARAIIDSNRYMTLGTANASGVPWVSPVWYAAAEYRRFFWVSSPEARHSRNLAARPQVSIVIFDTQAAIGAGQGVYMSGLAEELTGHELERAIAIFSRRSEAQGGRPWSPEDVRPPARHRLYCIVVSEHFVLTDGDERTQVSLA